MVRSRDDILGRCSLLRFLNWLLIETSSKLTYLRGEETGAGCQNVGRITHERWMDPPQEREREKPKFESRQVAVVSRSVALKMISISFLLFFFFFLIRHERYDPLTRSPLLYLSTVENERSILVRFIFSPPPPEKVIRAYSNISYK